MSRKLIPKWIPVVVFLLGIILGIIISVSYYEVHSKFIENPYSYYNISRSQCPFCPVCQSINNTIVKECSNYYYGNCADNELDKIKNALRPLCDNKEYVLNEYDCTEFTNATQSILSTMGYNVKSIYGEYGTNHSQHDWNEVCFMIDSCKVVSPSDQWRYTKLGEGATP